MLKSRSSKPRTINYHIQGYRSDGTQFGPEDKGSYLSPPTLIESIDSLSGKNSFNPCNHYKGITTFNGGSARFTHFSSGDYYIGDNFAYSISSSWVVPPSAPSPLLGDSQFILRAVQASIPKLKGDVSIPNFLFELKDLKRTLPTRERLQELSDICRIASGNPFRTSKKFTKSLKYYKNGGKPGREALSSLKDEIANQHLSANFGYLPLISDTFGIVDDVKLFNLRLSSFKKGLGKDRKFHFKESGAGFAGPEVVLLTTGTTRFSSITTFRDVSHVCTITAKCTANFSKLSVPTIFRKYLGFRANPRILWDAIPFSFLVDWVSSFGRFLETYDEGAVPVNFSISHIGLSTKFTAVTEYFVEDLRTYGFYDFTKKSIGRTEWTVYSRRPLVDIDFGIFERLPPLPTFKKLSVKQVTLGAALANNLLKK